MKREEKYKLRFDEMSKNEKQLKEEGYSMIAGVDEVGRGPLAGPVVAAAVVLSDDFDLIEINDSKKLSEKKREELFPLIKEKSVAYAIGMVSQEIIDEINILEATKMAMRGAVLNLNEKLKEKSIGEIDMLLIDALTLDNMPMEQKGIIKGDAKSISIAAASVLAKVTRDRLMMEYDSEYLGYGFASNKGYGTKAHYEGIEKQGICPIHRRSFLKKRGQR